MKYFYIRKKELIALGLTFIDILDLREYGASISKTPPTDEQ